MTPEEEIGQIYREAMDDYNDVMQLSNPTNLQLTQAMLRLTGYSARLRYMSTEQPRVIGNKAKEVAIALDNIVATIKYQIKVNIDSSFNNKT